MKNIKSFLLEKNEEPEISEKDKKEAQKFISSILQAFILNKGEDGSDEDLKKFVKDSLGDVPEEFSSWIEEMCIEAKKGFKKHSSKLKESFSDDPNDAEYVLEGRRKRELDRLRRERLELERQNKELKSWVEREDRKVYDAWTNKYYDSEEEASKARRKCPEFQRREAENKEISDKIHDEVEIQKLGDSTYKINGVKVSKHEYNEFLKKHPNARTSNDKETYKLRSKTYKDQHGDEYSVDHADAASGWYRYVNYGGARKTAIVLAVAGAAAIATAVAVHKAKKSNEKMIAGIKDKIQNEHNPETKKDYEEFYNNLLKSMYDENTGKIKLTPDTSKIPDDEKQYFNNLYKKSVFDKELKQSGEKYIKDNGSDFLIFDRKHLNKSEHKPKEEVVKADDGSEIHARRKKSGHGTTYVRTKNGEEVGYASKDDFMRAKQNESAISLKNALLESFES